MQSLYRKNEKIQRSTAILRLTYSEKPQLFIILFRQRLGEAFQNYDLATLHSLEIFEIQLFKGFIIMQKLISFGEALQIYDSLIQINSSNPLFFQGNGTWSIPTIFCSNYPNIICTNHQNYFQPLDLKKHYIIMIQQLEKP
ncbi:unnamed protein product [Paramecium octaurelia]|uniref:Uncharacterized protein n=1 Tax=Paramecium octaurelia TaxID=43137 RepID=A0A8S1X7X9_PAROT|nr:unnamed protein product [Paramecium octaurelia]CAD8197239.1 unnamed protein product [Paramecium octaurelia]